MNIITHSGKFHADEVLSVAILSVCFPDAEIVRTRDRSLIGSEDIAVDFGGGEFDHHWRGFDKRRENGELYSSAGLVWEKYSIAYLSEIVVPIAEKTGIYTKNGEAKVIAKEIDDTFISEVDRIDNGAMDPSPSCFSAVVRRLNPTWDDTDEGAEERQFRVAVEYAKMVLDGFILPMLARNRAKAGVLRCIERCKGSKVLIVDPPMPWQEVLGNMEHSFEFVVIGEDGDWKVQTIRLFSDYDGDCEEPRTIKNLPEAWAGLEGKDLVAVTGVETAKFCHRQRFIAGAETMVDAITLALKAL